MLQDPAGTAPDRLPSPPATAKARPPIQPYARAPRARLLAAAVALACAFSAGSAWAVALGRVTVQSLLGEPLRAEIDLPQLSAQDAASLQASVAPPERFAALNLSFNPALATVRMQLVQLPDGRNVLRLSSDSAVTEPFLDLLVQATWANGQLLRGYTLLFDPPNLRPVTPEPLLPAAVAQPQVLEVRPALPLPPLPAQAAPAAPVAPPPRAQAPAARPTPDAPRQVQVRRGDTAGRIAEAHRPDGVSLDQMLVALLRANPQAFMGNNVNRLRAGAVLDLPDAQAAAATPAPEARRLVQAQSRDFNEFRRRLAALAPAQDAPPGRAAVGAVQAEVTDERRAAAAQDRLTLERAAQAAAAERLAQARQQEATEQRAAEVQRNLQELERLRQAAAQAAPAAAPAAGLALPGAAVPPPAPPAAAQAPTEAPPPAPAPVAAPPEPAPAAAPAPEPAEPPAPPAPPPAPAPAPGLLQTLSAHPLALPAAGGAAVALLLGLLGLRFWRRKKAQTEPDEAAASELPPEADKQADAAPAASSMMYSPSQIDADAEVDPIAEADLYLAYGRDKQAEDILLEARRLHPERLPVHLKLLEVYGQRRDLDAFNAAAQALYEQSGGSGDEWAQAQEAGLLLDPDNPLYQVGATRTAASAAPPAANSSTAPTATADTSTPSNATDDLDFDLDLSAPAPATSAPQRASNDADAELEALLTGQRASTSADAPALDLDFQASGSSSKQASPSERDPSLELDFDLDLDAPATPKAAEPAPAAPAPATPPAPASAAATSSGLDFDLDLELDPAPTPAASPAAQGLPAEVQALSLDLDLDPMPEGSDPLETKLSLAQEFEAIGDADGARALAQEVEAEASGALKERARAFLARLN